eukprot:Gregarina_sp_Poly_1__9393@NODE_587_length_7368_cov_122_746473_g453_i0_p2_GENE_NODE_587_length_7368_cov_122_746473_g453_i0NODE_587_length_7368_cov_122_746473_g453_i0_p2_ORF_typecomplete_len679_score123_54Pkinase/PF00069_25/5e65Pkinase_Tyr/PF07714_17/1_1e38EFhand_7/PF13499_6/0_0011EFhand_7/PF13499_6/3_4e10EFhand_7/PF13499_6/1_2e14EFhand_8/PF13833_6/0_0048EFhand_8/PF13833_6/6_1e05EFhand_8/PF13833_6/0_012EFhand_8/PF13833_6/1e08EFhand_6/PF13405_6/0_0011EFhand_6/PF13405_6/4_5e06EFhand_6/PF13405_6/2_2e
MTADGQSAVSKPTADDLRKPFGVNDWVLRWVIETGWMKAATSCDSDPLKTADATFTEITLGLKVCFRYLQHVVPSPEEGWYVAVFHNYDLDEDGFIDFEDFADIVTKYHNHHAQRNLRHHKQRLKKQKEKDEEAPEASPKRSSTTTLKVGPKHADGEEVEDEIRGVQFVSHIVYPLHQGSCEVFKDYTFGSEAGQGAFGKVQVVTHKASGSRRACKSVVVARPRQWELIHQEIDIMKQLNHPNILRLYEIYHDGYTVYLIVELCEGGQLFDRIVEHYERLRRPITERQVGVWMTEILSAVAYCHEKDILHRDIKPENILFVDKSEDSPLKLIDFGLSSTGARIRENQHEEVEKKSGMTGVLAKMMPKIGGKALVSTNVKKLKMQRAGTPHYMAPEMIKGNYDERCDLFSVGVIMHQLLTGVHPYYIPGMDDEKSVELKILETVPSMTGPEWTYVSPAAKDLCRSLLRRNPLKRLTAREALSHPWFDQVRTTTSGLAHSLVSASVFEGLRSWQNQNKLKQAVVQLIARELSEKEICDLRRKFKALDKKKDGMISLDEVREAMRESGHHMVESDLQAMFANMGGAQGRIGWNEFLSALLCKRMMFQEKQLREIFKKFDVNNEGRVSVATLQKALKGTRKYGTLAADEVEDIFAEIDKNKDGFLDFYEFVELMTPEQFMTN